MSSTLVLQPTESVIRAVERALRAHQALMTAPLGMSAECEREFRLRRQLLRLAVRKHCYERLGRRMDESELRTYLSEALDAVVRAHPELMEWANALAVLDPRVLMFE